MAKKAPKAKKAKRPKTKKVFTKELILADWKKTVKVGLGKGKSLHPAIATNFEAKLLAKIDGQLKAGADYNKDGPNARAVAKFIGVVCKMLTPGNSVSLGVFEKVFAAGQLHPKCPGGAGSGQYCDI